MRALRCALLVAAASIIPACHYDIDKPPDGGADDGGGGGAGRGGSGGLGGSVGGGGSGLGGSVGGGGSGGLGVPPDAGPDATDGGPGDVDAPEDHAAPEDAPADSPVDVPADSPADSLPDSPADSLPDSPPDSPVPPPDADVPDAGTGDGRPRCSPPTTIRLSTAAPSQGPGEVPPSCDVVPPSGPATMAYSLSNCDIGWAACEFAMDVNMNPFDADNGFSGFMEVEFCTTTPVSGTLSLWYGRPPDRKRLLLLAKSETMPPGCRTARFAPEDAACHWNLFDNNCGAFCAACKGGCNAHCPITFEKVTLALVSEKCATPPAGTAQVVIRGIRFIPKDCACTANEDCAGSSDRPRCAQDMLTSMLCPTGSSGCGVCAPEVPCPAEGKTCEVRLSNTVCPGVLHCHGGTAACQLADPACAGM